MSTQIRFRVLIYFYYRVNVEGLDRNGDGPGTREWRLTWAYPLWRHKYRDPSLRSG
jgi:hypothetical protein